MIMKSTTTTASTTGNSSLNASFSKLSSSSSSSCNTTGNNHNITTTISAAMAAAVSSSHTPLPKTPYTVPSNHNLLILSFGRLYKGTNSAKYWRRKGNEYLHPLPLGYKATITISQHKFQMKVKEGDSGPVYQVRDLSTRELYSGSSATEPWNDIYTKLVLVGRPVGPSLFGFSDSHVQDILRSMCNFTSDSNIKFMTSNEKASNEKNMTSLALSSPQSTRRSIITMAHSSGNNNNNNNAIERMQTDECKAVHGGGANNNDVDDDGDDDMTDNEQQQQQQINNIPQQSLLFEGYNVQQWTQMLNKYRSKIVSDIDILERRYQQEKQHVKRNGKRRRTNTDVDYEQDPIRRDNQKRQKISNSQGSDYLLDANIYSLLLDKNTTTTTTTTNATSTTTADTASCDKATDTTNSTETAATTPAIVKSGEETDKSHTQNLNTYTILPESQHVDTCPSQSASEPSTHSQQIVQTSNRLRKSLAEMPTNELRPMHTEKNEEQASANAQQGSGHDHLLENTLVVDYTNEDDNQTLDRQKEQITPKRGSTIPLPNTTSEMQQMEKLEAPKEASLLLDGLEQSPELIIDKPTPRKTPRKQCSTPQVTSSQETMSPVDDDDQTYLDNLISPTEVTPSKRIFHQTKEAQEDSNVVRKTDEGNSNALVCHEEAGASHTRREAEEVEKALISIASLPFDHRTQTDSANGHNIAAHEDDDSDDDIVDEDETIMNINQVVEGLPDDNDESRVAKSSLEVYDILEDIKFPNSPAKDYEPAVEGEENDNNDAVDPGSPVFLGDGEDEDGGNDEEAEELISESEDDEAEDNEKQVGHQESTTSVEPHEAIPVVDTHRTESSTPATATPISSYIKPKMSQHSLPLHPISRINRENALLPYSRFSLNQPITHIEFSPNPKVAAFAVCTSSSVTVWELNTEKWEKVDDFGVIPDSEETFLTVRYTPDGDRLIIVGLFGDPVSYSQDFSDEGDQNSTQLSYSYQIRIFDLTGATLMPVANVDGSRKRQVEPILILRGNDFKILDVLIIKEEHTLISTNSGGVVIRYLLSEDWTERVEHIDLQRNDVSANGDYDPVVSLSLVPDEQYRFLLVGLTRNKLILWNYFMCSFVNSVQIPNVSIHKGHVIRVNNDGPRRGIMVILIFESISQQQQQQPMASQESGVKQVGLFEVGTHVSCLHIYKRKDNPASQQNPSATQGMTQPSRDNFTALTIHPSLVQSFYLSSGTDRGRILIFNYRSTQCVGILMDMHEEPITALSFNEHLPLLAIGGERGTVLMYYQNK